MDCDTARDILTRQAFAPDGVTDPQLAEAQAHIAACPACAAHLARFSQAILSPDQDEITCAESRARMDAYLTGRGVGEGMAAVTAHLAACRACAAEYAALQQTMGSVAQAALAPVPSYPTFDLSFLATPTPIWQQVRAGVRRLSYEIPAALALIGKGLLTPPPGLALSYATVTAARRGTRTRQQHDLVSLTVTDEAENLRIALSVSKSDGAAWLAVALSLLATGEPVGGARVALCDPHGLPQEIKTVRSGESEARFPAIGPGHYLIRVDRAGKAWELPVDLERL